MNKQELETELLRLKQKEFECQEELKRFRLQINNINKQLYHSLVGTYYKDRNLAYYKVIKDKGDEIKYIIILPNETIMESEWQDKQQFLDRLENSTKKEFEETMNDTYNYLIDL